jgi:hypothetical protein
MPLGQHERQAVECQVDKLTKQLQELSTENLTRPNRAEKWSKILDQLADLKEKLSLNAI